MGNSESKKPLAERLRPLVRDRRVLFVACLVLAAAVVYLAYLPLDGSTDELSVSAGQALIAPARQHKGKNLGDAAWEVIEVELKSGTGPEVPADAADPTVVDAEHYTVESENDLVRIVRIAYGAGEESVTHYHPDSVAVFLTDHLVEMTLPDGSTEEISASAGDALFTPAGEHLPKNISGDPWELVLVELK